MSKTKKHTRRHGSIRLGKRRMAWWGGLVSACAVALAYGAINFSPFQRVHETVLVSDKPIALTPDTSVAKKADAPRILAPRAITERTLREASRTLESKRTFRESVMAEGLISPDGLAFHPLTGDLFVSEEDAHAISRLMNGRAVRVLDAATPIFRREGDTTEQAQALRFPEAIAFSPIGDLLVAEDIPGGRLIGFSMDEHGRYSEGTEIPIPGDWSSFAWEGLDIGPSGEILLAGSDIEHVTGRGEIDVFSGVVLYRDREGTWWMPHRRLFASYSDARFAGSMKQAVYTCEITGEIGWLDLNSTYYLGGHSSYTARGPEGIAVLPDGSLVVAEERGVLMHIDPAADRHQRIVTGLSTIETVLWDPLQKQLVVTEDGSGRVLSFKPDSDFDADSNLMLYVRYQPSFSHLTIPQSCPDYLARILALGGLNLQDPGSAKITFRAFVKRVPLLSADLRATTMNPERPIDDPVERVQFVVFEPNRLAVGPQGAPSMSLAIFAVRTQSGRMITTSTLPLVMQSATTPEPSFQSHGLKAIAVPQASAASVSSLGVAAVQFLGYGRTPDYSLLINPRNPTDSYMVVFNADGSRDHYRLSSGSGEAERDWVIAYSSLHHEQWMQLSPKPEELMHGPNHTLAEVTP
jgi:hypothetical protein